MDVRGNRFREAGLILALALSASLLALGLTFVPRWPCPSCTDLELSVFGCEICRGPEGSDGRRTFRISFWRRRKAIQRLEQEGCRPIPCLPWRVWLGRD